MKLFLLLIIALFSGQILFAQSAEGGLAEEFTKLEDYLRSQKLTPEEKKKIFETNVINSLKVTLGRKVRESKKELKALKFQDIQTERPVGTNNLYVKYKNYYISYSYTADPESYLISPFEEKVLEKPNGADLNAAHSEEKTTTPPK
ncbi:LIC11625 family surface-exposed protein [Leptospira sp. 'Mane']|uniref:LIC11625 family surface-exposed protein n=1 Tax=Leptospira sp. 'Mane' TaxID=3387407 RepID=UPI00398B4B12